MFVNGLVKIKRFKDFPDKKLVMGVFKFSSNTTSSIEEIGFTIPRNDKVLNTLRSSLDNNDFLEITGKLYKKDKVFYIRITSISKCQEKYNLLSQETTIGLEL